MAHSFGAGGAFLALKQKPRRGAGVRVWVLVRLVAAARSRRTAFPEYKRSSLCCNRFLDRVALRPEGRPRPERAKTVDYAESNKRHRRPRQSGQASEPEEYKEPAPNSRTKEWMQLRTRRDDIVGAEHGNDDTKYAKPWLGGRCDSQQPEQNIRCRDQYSSGTDQI